MATIVTVSYHSQWQRRQYLRVFIALLLLSSSLCDALLRDLIVKGEIVSDADQYPYMTSLTNNGQHQCGGTLIAPDIILTAAHCISSITEVEVGRYNRSDENENYELYLVQSTVTHPNYYPHDYVPGVDVDPYDIGLIKIYGQSNRSLAKLSESVDSLEPNESLTIIGWGATNATSPTLSTLSDVLKSTTMSYMPNNECAAVTGLATTSGSTISYESQIIDVSLCALGRLGSDACTGDSGGPLFDAASVQVGINSASFGCANADLPSLNVRVSRVRSYIDEQVCALSDNPPKRFGCGRNVDASSEPNNSTNNVTVTARITLGSQPERQGWFVLARDALTMRETTVVNRNINTYASDIPAFSDIVESFTLSDDQIYTFVLLDASDDEGTMSVEVTARDEVLVFLYNVTFSKSYTQPFQLGNPPRPSRTSFFTTTAISNDNLDDIDSTPYLTLVLNFDNFPTETGYRIETMSDSGDVTDVVVSVVYPGTFGTIFAGRTVRRRIDLMPRDLSDREYRFVMTDNEHDGMVPGSYIVYLGDVRDGVELFSGGDFYLEDEHNFTVPGLSSDTNAGTVGSNVEGETTAVGRNWVCNSKALSSLLCSLFGN